MIAWRPLPPILLCVIPVAAAFAAAEPEEIVVLGSRIPATESQLEILDRRSLDPLGNASLAQVLELSSSIFVDANAGSGSINSLYLRGADPNLTQVQIDGIPVNDPNNSRGGTFDLSALNAELIERIEIMPNAGSALYGSAAMAGVVNIITRDTDDTATLNMSTSSIGGRHAGLYAGAGRLMLSAFHDDSGEIVTGSSYRNRGVILRSTVDLRDDDALRLGLRYQDGDAQGWADDSGGLLFAVNREIERRKPEESQASLQYGTTLDGGGELTVDGGWFEHRERIWSPAVAPGLRDPAGLPAGNSDSSYRRRHLRLQYLAAAQGSYRFAVGLEWQGEHGTSLGNLDFGVFQLPASFALERDTGSVFGELRWQPSADFSVTLGGRFDDTEDGDRWLPKLGIARAFRDRRHTLFLNWGEGYKLPSFYALGHPLIGNPGLRPESADTLEAGYRYRRGGTTVDLILFRNVYENLVDFEPGPPPRLVNRDEVTAQGLETRISGQFNEFLSWQARYSYLDTDVRGNANGLRKRPRHRAGLDLDWRLGPDWHLYWQTRYVASRLDSSIPTADLELPSWTRSDLILGWQVNDRTLLTASANNLFDRTFQNSIGNPVAGRFYRLDLRYRL